MTDGRATTAVASVDAHVLSELEAGVRETRTLSEGLAIRMDRLMAAVAPEARHLAFDASTGIVRRMSRAGAILRETGSTGRLAASPSDTARGWAAFAIGQDDRRDGQERIAAMRVFAADPHFGVREWAWMAVRAIIVADPLASVATLAPWTADPDPNVRRFASEATRPRGVWAASIPLLRREPDRGLPILRPLRHAAERYVQDSVANWINDAAKDHPGWATRLAAEWTADAVGARLLSRSLRSVATGAAREQRVGRNGGRAA